MDYTHFQQIVRDDGGRIERHKGVRELAARGTPGVPGFVVGYRVVSVEDGPVAGWGFAERIGKVQTVINGEDHGEPFLAFVGCKE